MASQTALIQYIGKQNPRMDDVLRNPNRSWPNPGSVVEVPRGEASAYLAHPGEWQEITLKQQADLEKSKQIVTLKIDEIIAESENMPSGELKILIDKLTRVFDRREKAQALKTQAEAKKNAQKNKEDEQMDEAKQSRGLSDAPAPVKVDAQTREGMVAAIAVCKDEAPVADMIAMIEHFRLPVSTEIADADDMRAAVVDALNACINA